MREEENSSLTSPDERQPKDSDERAQGAHGNSEMVRQDTIEDRRGYNGRHDARQE